MRYPPSSITAATIRAQTYFYCLKINIAPFPLLLTPVQDGWKLDADGLDYIYWPIGLREPDIVDKNNPMKIDIANEIHPEYGLRPTVIDSELSNLGGAEVQIWKVIKIDSGWEETLIFDGNVLSTAWTEETFVLSVSQFWKLQNTPGTPMATTLCLWTEQGGIGCDYIGTGKCSYSLKTCRPLVYAPTHIGTGVNDVDTRGENYKTFPVTPNYSRYDVRILADGASYEYRYNDSFYAGVVPIVGGWQEFINNSDGQIDIGFFDSPGTYTPDDIFRFQVSNENNFGQPGLYAPSAGDVVLIRDTKVGISPRRRWPQARFMKVAQPPIEEGLRIDAEGRIGHGSPIPTGTGLEESEA